MDKALDRFIFSKIDEIRDEWTKMTEEDKRLYTEMVEKETAKEEENKTAAADENQKKSTPDNSNHQKISFGMIKPTPLILFIKMKKDTLKEEWNAMTEEEKRPYVEMVEKERKLGEIKNHSQALSSHLNMRKTDNESSDLNASSSHPKISFSKTLGQQRALFLFLNSKNKDIKESWDKMTEEEKKPYIEMAEKEQVEPKKQKDPKEQIEPKEPIEPKEQIEPKEPKEQNESKPDALNQHSKSKFTFSGFTMRKPDNTANDLNVGSKRPQFSFSLHKKTAFDFYSKLQKDIFTKDWEKMTEEDKKPYFEMVEREREERKKMQEEKEKTSTTIIKYPPSKQVFKLVIIGDGAVGKTSFVNVMKNGVFNKDYKATIGVQVTPITFQTSSGMPITFMCWDVAGQEKNRGITESYYMEAECMILMFDLTEPSSYRNLDKLYGDFTRKPLFNKQGNENVPWVLVGNKIDDSHKKVSPLRVNFHKKHPTSFIQISCKSNYNIDIVFLHLARLLKNDPKLEFV